MGKLTDGDVLHETFKVVRAKIVPSLVASVISVIVDLNYSKVRNVYLRVFVTFTEIK